MKTNKKLFMGIILVLTLMLCLAFGASAEETFTEGYYTYTVTDGKATITAVDKSISGDIIVPDELSGYSVTSIGDCAFNGTSIESIIISDSVTSIGYSSFGASYSLKSVTIPDGVTSIGFNAFGGCISLESIAIPDSVVIIGAHAFAGCTSLTSAVIGKGLTSISDAMFDHCTSLVNVIIPDSVTSIGEEAFFVCSSLESIRIPDSVTSIHESAFDSCKRLKNVTIGKGITSIHSMAFYDCIKLSNVHYCGTQEQWENVKIGSSNKWLTDIAHVAADENKDGDCDLCINCTAPEHIHSYTVHVESPTCIDKGYTIYSCDFCSNSYIENVIPATGKHKYTAVVNSATCTQGGYTEYICSCGKSYSENIVPALGHSYTAVTTPATCTVNGQTVYTCSCNDTYTEIIPTTGHDYQNAVCTKCGDSKADDCSHICHKSGFIGFIWKIICFFQKLFKTNPICECGMAHY